MHSVALVVDTGPLVAAVGNDPDHAACAELLKREAASLVVPALVLAEASYLVRKALGASGEAALLRAASRGEFRLELPTASDLQRMAEVVETYADLPLGTIDASIVATAERLGEVFLTDPSRGWFDENPELQTTIEGMVPMGRLGSRARSRHSPSISRATRRAS